MKKEIIPKCVPFNKHGFAKKTKNCPAFIASGHLLPCCWMDKMDAKDRNDNNLWDEELKISNVNSIDEILYSKQWKEFYKKIFENSDDVSIICWKHCGIITLEDGTTQTYWEYEKNV